MRFQLHRLEGGWIPCRKLSQAVWHTEAGRDSQMPPGKQGSQPTAMAMTTLNTGWCHGTRCSTSNSQLSEKPGFRLYLYVLSLQLHEAKTGTDPLPHRVAQGPFRAQAGLAAATAESHSRDTTVELLKTAAVTALPFLKCSLTAGPIHKADCSFPVQKLWS